ncbi:ABC transporter substrate-binding protein [Humitalea sp. 24SJ18S-53]|uniref:ABC transporter substrate-binding protein n=1 Tax=Humitalea sp. 24SJ18S-53 TaxID=3422307 RepID=UPI003D66D59D
MIDLSRRQLALATAALALPAPAFAQVDTPRRGGTLTMAVVDEPPTLVTLATTAQSSVIVSAKVTEGLLAYDFDLNPQPQLATEWSQSEDGLRTTFKLRQGVKWHDGQDFTSADVAYSLMTLKRVHPRGQSTFQNLERVETPDPHTAILVLSRPAPYLLGALVACESPIVAKHIYEPSGANVAANPNGAAPIGTGPFRFKEWARGRYLIYERNPDYWGGPDKPYLDRVIVRFMGDASARSIGLETGEIDLAGWSPVPLSDVQRLSQLPQIAIETRGNEYQNNLFYRIEFNLENRYFSNEKVRQAIAHAIDKRVILAVVFLNYGVIANGPVSPNLKSFFDASMPSIPFDLRRADALLDEAGFPRGADGIRFRVTQDAQAGPQVQIAQYMRSSLRRVGIEVTVRTEDLGSYVRRVYTDRNFDFNAQGSTQMFDPTIGTQRFYWSKNFRPGVPYSNGARYMSPAADDALEAAATEIDPAKRREHFSRFQRQINTDVPAIGLVAQAQITVANKRVVNHTTTAEGVSANFANVFLRS